MSAPTLLQMARQHMRNAEAAVIAEGRVPRHALELRYTLECVLQHLEARELSGTGLAQLIADVRAEQREADAKVCAALEDEFAGAAGKLQHTHSERTDVLRAQADGCAHCALAIREAKHD